jgi:hypothetical protein
MQSFHDTTVDPKGDPTPDVAGQNQLEGRVDRLEQEVLGIRGDLSQLMRMMESTFSQNAARPEYAHQNPPDPHPHQAPHQVQGNQAPFHPDPPAGFYPRMEPPRLSDVWFSGDSSQLLSFLRVICDHLRPRVSFFESDTRQIIWISRHFGHGPSSQRKSSAPSPAENWYTSLITDNA